MEITIKINGRFVSVEVSAEVADYLEQAKRNNRKLYRERQRYWDGRECDEYIVATEGRLPYGDCRDVRLYQRFGTDFHQRCQKNFSEILEIGPYERPPKWAIR